MNSEDLWTRYFFLDRCCFENSLFFETRHGIAKVHFEIIQMYSIVVNRGDDRNARSDFCRTRGYRIRQIYTPRFSIHRGMKSVGRSVSWHAIANLGSTRPLGSSFPSRLVTVTPVFLRFRGEYEITLIEYRHVTESSQLGVENSLKKVT